MALEKKPGRNKSKVRNNVFFPDDYLDSIFKIDYEELYKKGIRGLLYDIDNTLVATNHPEPGVRLISLFDSLRAMGFGICLISNNNELRVREFNKKLRLHAVHKAGKPRSKGILRALHLLGVEPGAAALIGDQVFTDVWCGRRHGLYTILVRPLTTKDEFTVAVKRYLEKPIIAAYLRYKSGR